MAGRGGAREGSGGHNPLTPERVEAKLDLEREQTRATKARADRAELELAIRRGEFLPRVAQQTAAATALALLAQSLRALPDNLERTLSLAPDVAEQIAVGIDAALAECAAAFRAMTVEDSLADRPAGQT